MTTLNVYSRESPCGQLTEDRLGQLKFRYLESWLENAQIPVSLTLPLAETVYEHNQVAPFVANLLPESGDLRNRLERLLHVDASHDFGLLAAIGRESAGALSFWPEDEPPVGLQPDYHQFDIDEFHQWREIAHHQPFQFLGKTIRLSLAGIQPKTALYFDQENVPFVPLNGAATTHIIKPHLQGCTPNTIYTELVTMKLARAVLGEEEVPEVDIWENCYRIRRFDRIRVDGGIKREHQEDFCLALGRMPERKYESKSPRERLLASSFELIDQLGDRGMVVAPVLERQRLLNLVIINTLLHNPDAHLKNYSLLYQDNGTVRIAPLYDCLCTYGLTFKQSNSAWSQEGGPAVHTKELSLRIGDALNIDTISLEDWAQFAVECGFTKAFIKRRVSELADSIFNVLPKVAASVIANYPNAKAAIGFVTEGVTRQITPLISRKVHNPPGKSPQALKKHQE